MKRLWALVVWAALAATAAATIPAGGCRRPSPVPRVMVTSGGVEMVLVPGGRLTLRAGADGPRDVAIASFWIDRREVTQRHYESLVDANPSRFRDPDAPVERVSWRSAVRYCNARSLAEGLTPCYDPQTFECDFEADGYRLPTEAEWEYACRAGSTGAFCFGDSADALRHYGWFRDNSGGRTHPTGRLRSNAWGLFDMHGNVAEWCNDAYVEWGGSPAGPTTAPAASQRRAVRGGSFAHSAAGCRSDARYGENPAFADACLGSEMYGFRCVRRAK